MNTKKALFFAGFTAIWLNTIMLKVTKYFGVKAESGGLLKLVLQLAPKNISENPVYKTEWFWFAFHLIIGGLMVIIYFVFFDKLTIRLWAKGALISLLPWLINGVVVLPLLGQGLFGSEVLPMTGIVYFFWANVLFGYSLVYTLYILKTEKNKKPRH